MTKKKIKVKNFRKISLWAIILILPIALYLVQNRVNIYNKAFGTKANIVVDASSSFESTKSFVWKNLAQGGENESKMLSSVGDNIKKLDTKYIRIDHIFDAYNLVNKDLNGSISLNWTDLDQTIRDIQTAGAKPFISLSYMPGEFSKDGVNGLPNNWADWEYIVQKTIEHLSGQMAIDNVYYEVWNEPDLFGKYKPGFGKNYFELYYHSAISAERTKNVKPFKIGGPATTTYMHDWVRELLNYTLEKNIRLDFISWHKYSKNIDEYLDDTLNIINIVGDYSTFKNTELILSETGINSENDKAYDGLLSAIHTIAVSTELEGKIDKLFSFEVKDGPGPEKYWGRWGILTNDKYGPPEEKPRFKALQFLNGMDGQIVNTAGDGSWVKSFAKKNDQIVKILLVNYDIYGKHYETVPVQVNGLSAGKYMITRTEFLGGSSNADYAVSGGTISLLVDLNPNSAVILTLVPH